ncbi:MAG: signal peptide peptidase SppA [Proteobacteria bacterium]|nr:signal peptide peptidase SppA [Pseudomonadota bacterium]
MSLNADTIVDRRRMRRKLTFWRVVAVVLAVAALVTIGAFASGRAPEFIGGSGGQIARVTIRGLIRTDQERVEALERLGRTGSAKAVIVRIDTPGGTTAGAEQLYTALAQLRRQKPMVVVVDGLAASGGYIAAMAADHIIAQQTSLVGSIGVLFQYPNVADLLKTVGVKVEEIKSSPLKAAPNGYQPTSPEARAAIESIVRDTFQWFKGLVQTRRGIEGELLERVADGRVFTGRQAIELKLIDEVGNERTARAWLAKVKGIDEDTPVRDWSLRSRFGDLPFLHLAAAAALEAVGLSSLARRLEHSGALQAIERLNLDGLLALWHPPASP